MEKANHLRAGCVDVFRSYLVEHAAYAGDLEIPVIAPIDVLPTRIIPFSQAISSKDKHQWVHFFEDDYKFERVWNNPRRYLRVLAGFDGVISPDFSVYRDMPLVMQHWNIYRSRAIATALQNEGVPIIPNVRFGDQRTWEVCCQGLPENSIIAIGSHGNLKNSQDRDYFTSGLEHVVKALHPRTIVVYGSTPKAIFAKYEDQGIRIIQFESNFAVAHKERS